MSDVPNVLNLSLPEDPRLLLSEPFRAVHFVYGLFHPAVRPLSGRALVGSLTALGFTEEGARGILLRLRRGGFLASRRIGREAVYALTSRSSALLDEIARRSSDPAPPWDAVFDALVVRAPSARRAFREQLRRHATYAGFGSPSAGLWVAPYPVSIRRLEALLATRPRDVEVIRGRLTVDAEDAVLMAEAAWDLGPTAAALRRETAGMLAAARAARARPPEGPDALRVLWQSIGPYFELLSVRPPLPAELLPPGWPMDEARGAFMQLAMHVAPRANRYVTELDGERA